MIAQQKPHRQEISAIGPKPKLGGIKKQKVKKRKRMIIRNLSFKVEEEELKQIFSKFGDLLDVKIPLQQDGKKRGFAFVEFKEAKSLINAMKTMNYKEIQGRKVAIDFAVDKSTYETKLQKLKQEGKEIPMTKKDIKPESEIKAEELSDEEEDTDSESDEIENIPLKEESESEDEDEKRLNEFLREFDSGANELTKSKPQECDSWSEEESSSDESDGENEIKEEIKTEHKQPVKETDSKLKERQSKDVSEGKTVFLRNVAFTTDEDSLREAMEDYGECEYCVLCVDRLTDHPKGTAFVKFKNKSSADELIRSSFDEPGVVVDGRKLSCSSAMSREDVSHVGDDAKKPKDKRNLNLLRVGLIMPDSKESEGVSHTDMAKRAQLEMLKKQKLRNVNFFVSDKRLMVHNIPKNYTDNDLRKMFKTAAGAGAAVIEARVMKEFSKTDAQGNPLTKGFGFVTFKNHEQALKALNELNNNPKTFTSQRRPIVEFSIENIVALHSKEKRKEKLQMRNKRRTEEKRERKLNMAAADTTKTPSVASPTKGKKRKNKKNKPTVNKRSKVDPVEDDNTLQEVSSPTKEQNGKKRKNKKNKPTVNKRSKVDHVEEDNTLQEVSSPIKEKNKKRTSKLSKKEKKQRNKKSSQDSMVNLINQYKDKLKNKIT